MGRAVHNWLFPCCNVYRGGGLLWLYIPSVIVIKGARGLGRPLVWCWWLLSQLCSSPHDAYIACSFFLCVPRIRKCPRRPPIRLWRAPGDICIKNRALPFIYSPLCAFPTLLLGHHHQHHTYKLIRFSLFFPTHLYVAIYCIALFSLSFVLCVCTPFGEGGVCK